MVRMVNYDSTQQHGKIVGIFVNTDKEAINYKIIKGSVLVCFMDRIMGVKGVNHGR